MMLGALKCLLLLLPLVLLAFAALGADAPAPRAVLVIHGGAGAMPRDKMTPEREREYRADLEQALREGYKALRRDGGTSLDAVEAAIRVLEDSPRFNAGKGAVFTHDGRNELDASIMDGKDKRAGAVAAVRVIKNPIRAARAVLEKSPHVMLVGRGAELFATEQGLEIVDPTYFWTLERWDQLRDALKKEEAGKRRPAKKPAPQRPEMGTVGAVAVDRHGNLAAGTSTGGMTNKRFGRVGDSPIIGAGTYADNAACAVSGTGHGETFIRYAVAHDIAALVKYKGLSVQEAAEHVMRGLPKEPGGVGGVIALDAQGNFAMPFNTAGMFRGYITGEGAVHIAMYPE
jgi:beta-aspartyl-peptidase (threonine type)